MVKLSFTGSVGISDCKSQTKISTAEPSVIDGSETKDTCDIHLDVDSTQASDPQATNDTVGVAVVETTALPKSVPNIGETILIGFRTVLSLTCFGFELNVLLSSGDQSWWHGSNIAVISVVAFNLILTAVRLHLLLSKKAPKPVCWQHTVTVLTMVALAASVSLLVLSSKEAKVSCNNRMIKEAAGVTKVVSRCQLGEVVIAVLFVLLAAIELIYDIILIILAKLYDDTKGDSEDFPQPVDYEGGVWFKNEDELIAYNLKMSGL